MGYETLIVDVRIEANRTLNRPERMNALSQKLCAELPEALRAADQDPDVRVVVITGAGGKAFSAGYDIKESAEAPRRSLAEWRDRLNRDLQFTFAPWNCTKPVIAMISGYCLAGALEFAQMCDIRYCSDDSRFGVVETRFSNGIATYIMPWILGNRCRELIYTGDTFDGERAFRLGLVDRVFPKALLERETMKIAFAPANHLTTRCTGGGNVPSLCTAVCRNTDDDGKRHHHLYMTRWTNLRRT